MKFTKFGHSCLLIEEGNARILLDPGSYSAGFENLENLDLILITHEHGDHVEVARLKVLLKKNPQVKIVTVPAVKELLAKEGIASEVLGDGETMEIKGVSIEGYGTKHAEIYKTFPLADNTGFMIGGRFFYPGDNFTIPPKPVEILGAPTMAPWMRVSEGIDYMLAVKPKVAISMHDGILKHVGLAHSAPAKVLENTGTQFMVLEEGKMVEL